MHNLIFQNNLMIEIPMRETYNLNIGDPIKSYIQAHYAENSNKLIQSAHDLNQLRNEALISQIIVGETKLKLMLKYYDQLVAIEKKLPINQNEIKIEFKWKNALTNGKAINENLTLCDGIYERLSVLFNIGAFCSRLAIQYQYDSENGLKEALRLYKLAASCFEYLKNNPITLTSNQSSDFNATILNTLLNIMLAQGQEIGVLKLIKEKSKSHNISKLAIQCSDYYAISFNICKDDEILKKLWISQLKSKYTFYLALAQYNKALDDCGNFDIASALARFKCSKNLLISNDIQGIYKQNANSLLNDCKKNYEEISEQNKKIYKREKMSEDQLAKLERFDLFKMKKEIKFPLTENFIDLFNDLLPQHVNGGLKYYRSDKTEIFEKQIRILDDANSRINGFSVLFNTLNSLSQSLNKETEYQRLDGGLDRMKKMIDDHSSMSIKLDKNLDEFSKNLNGLKSDKKNQQNFVNSHESLKTEIVNIKNEIQNSKFKINQLKSKIEDNKTDFELLSKSNFSERESLKKYLDGEFYRLKEEVTRIKCIRLVLISEIKNFDDENIIEGLKKKLLNSPQMDSNVICKKAVEEATSTFVQRVEQSLKDQEELKSFIETLKKDYELNAYQNRFKNQNLEKKCLSFIELITEFENELKSLNQKEDKTNRLKLKINEFLSTNK